MLLLAVATIAQASPLPVPTATPLPVATPLPTSPATASPAPTVAPAPAPAPQPSPFGYVVAVPPPPPGTPGILEVAVSSQTLHSGGPWLMRVTTTLEVTEVAVEGYGVRFALFPAGAGVFSAMGTLPNAPAQFLNRDYAMAIIGSTADGRRATASISLRLVR
jgi:hypothetical protein